MNWYPIFQRTGTPKRTDRLICKACQNIRAKRHGSTDDPVFKLF